MDRLVRGRASRLRQGRYHFYNNTDFSSAGGAAGLDYEGWIAGGQVGYNQQVGRLIFGLEATLSEGEMHEQALNVPNPDPITNTTRFSTEIGPIFTLTARLGYTFAPRWMGYVKGGFASAEVEATLDRANTRDTSSASASARHNGWALGRWRGVPADQQHRARHRLRLRRPGEPDSPTGVHWGTVRTGTIVQRGP